MEHWILSFSPLLEILFFYPSHCPIPPQLWGKLLTCKIDCNCLSFKIHVDTWPLKSSLYITTPYTPTYTLSPFPSHHNSAILRTTGNDMIIMWTPINVQNWSSVPTHGRIRLINAPCLGENKGDKSWHVVQVSHKLVASWSPILCLNLFPYQVSPITPLFHPQLSIKGGSINTKMRET